MKNVFKTLSCAKGQSSIETLLCLPIVLASSFAFILLGLLSMAHQIQLYGAHEFLLCTSLKTKTEACRVEYQKTTDLFSPLLRAETRIFQTSRDRWRLELNERGLSIPLLNIHQRVRTSFEMEFYQRTSHDR